MHMTVSLLIKTDVSVKQGDIGAKQLADEIAELVPDMPVAGGRVSELGGVRVVSMPADEKAARRIGYSLLPGFALTLNDLPPGGPKDYLRIAALERRAVQVTEERFEWPVVKREQTGYLVPLTVGYRAVSPLAEAGTVPTARNQSMPFCLAEPVHAIGEWRSPHRIRDLNEILWRYETAPGYYLCRTGAETEAPDAEIDFSDINFFE